MQNTQFPSEHYLDLDDAEEEDNDIAFFRDPQPTQFTMLCAKVKDFPSPKTPHMDAVCDTCQVPIRVSEAAFETVMNDYMQIVFACTDCHPSVQKQRESLLKTQGPSQLVRIRQSLYQQEKDATFGQDALDAYFDRDTTPATSQKWTWGYNYYEPLTIEAIVAEFTTKKQLPKTQPLPVSTAVLEAASDLEERRRQLELTFSNLPAGSDVIHQSEEDFRE